MCREVWGSPDPQTKRGKLFYFSQIEESPDEDGTCGSMAVEGGMMGRFPYPFEKTPQKICRAAVQPGRNARPILMRDNPRGSDLRGLGLTVRTRPPQAGFGPDGTAERSGRDGTAKPL